MPIEHPTDRLSEYLDGELPAAEAERVAAHLEACPECGATLEELRAVVERARALGRPSPPRDLWPGIAARIGGGEAPDLRLGGGRRTPVRERRLSLSLPQLAAAAIGLMLLSGSAVWVLAGAGPDADRGPAPAETIATPGDPGGPSLTASVPEPGPGVARYEAAIAELQRALFHGEGALDSVTVRKLRASLSTIDRAIEEARRALEEDPADTYLHHHLADTMQRKVRFLRETAALVAAQS